MPPGSFTPLTRETAMAGGGRYGLAPGEFTDDTSMALCLAFSLVLAGGHSPTLSMMLYRKWYEQGFLGSTGECFDIGITTRKGLYAFAAAYDTWRDSCRTLKQPPPIEGHAASCTATAASESASQSASAGGSAAAAASSCSELAQASAPVPVIPVDCVGPASSQPVPTADLVNPFRGNISDSGEALRSTKAAPRCCCSWQSISRL